MANNFSITTLEELGWIPCWDKDGRYPISQDDTIKIEPASKIKIYLKNRPIQEADGFWYGNKITMYEPFPTIVGGVYEKEKILTDSTICGGENQDSLIGKIEEFAFWDRDVGVAGIYNYQENMVKMISSEVGSMYASVSEASADSLKYYYNFSQASILTKNFSNEGSQVIKTSLFNISSGKHSNASVVSNENYAKIESMNFAEEFTLSTRIYLEEMEDFVLFDNPASLKITFNATNKVFKVSVVPYIGVISEFDIEVPDLKVHSWYDIGILFGNSSLKFIKNGEEIESFVVKYTIGGASRLSLSHKNIESVHVVAGSGTGVVHRSYAQFSYRSWGHCRAYNNDSETERMITAISGNAASYLLDGGENVSKLLIDKDENSIAGASIATAYSLKSYIEDDSVSKKGTISLFSKGLQIINESAPGAVTEIKELDNNKVEIRTKPSTFHWDVYYHHNNKDPRLCSISIIPTTLHPLTHAYMEINTKGSLIKQGDVFPKMLIFPTTRLKVEKIRVDPPYALVEKEKAVAVNFAIHSSVHGIQHWRGTTSGGGYSALVSVGNSEAEHIIAPDQQRYIGGDEYYGYGNIATLYTPSGSMVNFSESNYASLFTKLIFFNK